MQPRPAFWGRQISSAFQEETVVDSYQHRPPYPSAVFDILANLATDEPRRVLDAGCGTGFLARRLAGRVAHVDALDISPAMIERGQRLPGGDSPLLTWIVGAAETAPLNPPYSLITSGDSLHWMEWDAVMPRFAESLTPGGVLAILGVSQLATPWDDELMVIIKRYSTVKGFQPIDLVAELQTRGLFRTTGKSTTEPVPFTQPLDAYIASFHGRASFSRERMGEDIASIFDAEVRALVSQHVTGEVTLHVLSEVTWGRPLHRGE